MRRNRRVGSERIKAIECRAYRAEHGAASQAAWSRSGRSRATGQSHGHSQWKSVEPGATSAVALGVILNVAVR